MSTSSVLYYNTVYRSLTVESLVKEHKCIAIIQLRNVLNAQRIDKNEENEGRASEFNLSTVCRFCI